MRTAGGLAAALLLAGCAAGGTSDARPPRAEADWTRAASVAVRLEDYRFVPDALTFRQGMPYRLRLENRSAHQHEFTAPAFFAAIAVRDPGIVSAARPEIVVDPGQDKELYFVAV